MARVWWSAGTLPRSQRMNAIAGPRSRCPSRYRKSDTISPRVSRYQSRAARNRVVPSTTCPSRWISAARRAGRWVALTRASSGPKFSGSGARPGSAGCSGTPCTTRTGYPLGSRSRTAWPPRCAVTVPPVPRASRSRSSRAAAAKVGPTNRGRGPRRTTRHADPACRPRSTSACGVRSTTVKPKSVPNRSARSRSGFSNSSQASPATLTSGLPDRPGCSPGRAPVWLCSERCGSSLGARGAGVRAGLGCVVMIGSLTLKN